MNNPLFPGNPGSIFAQAMMSTSRQVTCIKQNIFKDRHEKITHIGGNWGTNGTRVTITEEQAIKDIRNNISYFVKDSKGDVAKIEIIKHFSGKEYLKTIPDHTKADNLLSLPPCP